MKSTTLYYREGSSDKVYRAAIEPKGQLFIVTFAYGRRGTTLQAGVKTPNPVNLPEAERIFERLVREKMSKGYTLGESGTPYEQSEKAGVVSGILPQLLNPIDEDEALGLAKSPLWCLQEKIDGRRLLIKKEGATIQGINRNGLFTGFPNSIAEVLRETDDDFILDGECVGETFHAFDLLSWNGESWTKRGYGRRIQGLIALLGGYVGDYIVIVETVFEEEQKLATLKGLEECGAEGVVLKLRSAEYTPGRPASCGPALKYKFTTTGSFIVARVNECRSVSVKLYDEDSTLGNVAIPPNHSVPDVGAVVEVRYLYAFRRGSLFQPVYLGERDDCEPHECLVNQLKFKREEADDDGE